MRWIGFALLACAMLVIQTSLGLVLRVPVGGGLVLWVDFMARWRPSSRCACETCWTSCWPPGCWGCWWT